MNDAFCKFEWRNELQEEVHCLECGRAFTGTPEYYANRIFCRSKIEAMDGPGTDLEEIFNWWAKRFRMSLGACPKCQHVKMLMNLHGKEWVRANIDVGYNIAGRIQANARLQDINLPSPMIKRWLRKVSED